MASPGYNDLDEFCLPNIKECFIMPVNICPNIQSVLIGNRYFVIFWLSTADVIHNTIELEVECENSLFDTYMYTPYTTRNMWLKKLYKYSREAKAKVHAYRYRQSHWVGYAVTHDLI